MKKIMIPFYILLVFVIFNTVLMTLYFTDNEYEYTIFSHSYIEAILPEQPTNQSLTTGIARIKEPSPETLESGDYVVTYDKDERLLSTGGEFALVSEILVNNQTSETLTITYDDVVSITLPYEEIIGEYQRDAGLIGTYYYTSMFFTGYAFLMISHIILLSGYYFVFIYDNPNRFLNKK
ncbi:MAG: hypothetical protein ACQEQA_05530 [Bacillota bacterium]